MTERHVKFNGLIPMCGKASTACTRKAINVEGEGLERRMEGRREEERRKVGGEVKGV